jgi:hypothetical protein
LQHGDTSAIVPPATPGDGPRPRHDLPAVHQISEHDPVVDRGAERRADHERPVVEPKSRRIVTTESRLMSPTTISVDSSVRMATYPIAMLPLTRRTMR